VHTDRIEIKRIAQCMGELQMWDILISWKPVKQPNRKSERPHRQRGNQT